MRPSPTTEPAKAGSGLGLAARMSATEAAIATANPTAVAPAMSSQPRPSSDRAPASEIPSQVPGNPPPGGNPRREPSPAPSAQADSHPQGPAATGFFGRSST